MEVKKIVCKSIVEWRNWLEKNYEKEDRVMLVRYKKHTRNGTFNQRQAMDEAICFGWIDTTLKRIDDDLYGVTFVKRKKTSKWSYNTLAKARKMIKHGKMSDFGKKMYEDGLKRPPHDHGIPKNPDIPDFLKIELEKKKNKKAKENLVKLSNSQKRIYFRWILSAKKDETLKRRIKQTVNKLKERKKFED